MLIERHHKLIFCFNSYSAIQLALAAGFPLGPCFSKFSFFFLPTALSELEQQSSLEVYWTMALRSWNVSLWRAAASESSPNIHEMMPFKMALCMLEKKNSRWWVLHFSYCIYSVVLRNCQLSWKSITACHQILQRSLSVQCQFRLMYCQHLTCVGISIAHGAH